ncbi:TetR/AcrR family transcriptional regulator [Erwiniaceae bacterium BAC15a-03b]|uniref:TetR/AcrR family transcriptional regulator n=1 Tax=Winslowiella arboricola TaxID=2978220 RepID=A0A9J6PSJ3_9GAMM|nr:TetR/AcrR family transcriptional regulator [Winslowiella arboricola]MCU5775480.1 TetR/AcrR family transcriptional regulator [Winslowiella arboricola]MCU5779670.1 TetR/AcrR family transcriptional regulator [Winslowiella arboricola]
MSTREPHKAVKGNQPRIRLAREERFQQLLEVAWQLIRAEGSEALTLGRLATQAGVTKPVVYDHFGTRSGLFAVLYQQYDASQTALMDAAFARSEATLAARATVIASSYVDCVVHQGREIQGVIAALTGTPELEKLKYEYQKLFIDKCHVILAPFTHGATLPPAALWAMLGAAESLSWAAASGEISAGQAKDELFASIVAMVDRNAAAN